MHDSAAHRVHGRIGAREEQARPGAHAKEEGSQAVVPHLQVRDLQPHSGAEEGGEVMLIIWLVALVAFALAVDNLPVWHRIADRGRRRVAR